MSTELSQTVHSRLDHVGACVSFACAIHCIALPAIITALPLLGLGFLAGHTFEAIMLVVSVTLASASLCWGTRVHGKRNVLLFILAAAVLFSLGFFVFDGSKHWTLIGFGGLCLAVGHVINRKLCRSCQHCQEH